MIGGMIICKKVHACRLNATAVAPPVIPIVAARNLKGSSMRYEPEASRRWATDHLPPANKTHTFLPEANGLSSFGQRPRTLLNLGVAFIGTFGNHIPHA